MKNAIIFIFFLFLSTVVCSAQNNGQLDPSFGNNGVAVTDFGFAYSWAYAMEIQTDGKIVLAGCASPDGNRDKIVVARFDSTGILDPSFGNAGQVITKIGSAGNDASSVVIQKDGKIVVGGSVYFSATDYDFALIRYNTDGSLDNSFGTNGIVTTDFGATFDKIFSIVLQTDGKIVVGGYSSGNTKNCFTMARYNTDGSLDTSFDSDGKVVADFGGDFNDIESIAIQSDRKIVVGGATSLPVTIGGNSIGQFALARYNENGTLDTTFGTGGKVVTNFNVNYYSHGISSIKILSSGKILAGGYAQYSSNFNSYFALAQYNADGTLDTTFSADGKVTTGFASLSNRISKLSIQADGKIIAVGNGSGNVAIAKYNSDGSLDLSYLNSGKLLGIKGRNTNNNDIHVLPNGKFLVAGTISGNPNYKFGVFCIGWYNDNCYDAIELPVYGSTCGSETTGNVALGTNSTSAILCNGKTGNSDDDIWYKFIAKNTSHTITVTGTQSFDAVVDLRSGTCNSANTIACASATGLGGEEIINASGLTIGNTYYIRVYDFAKGIPATSKFDICITTPQTVGINELISDNFITITQLQSIGVFEVESPELGSVQIINIQGQIIDDLILSEKKTNLDLSRLPEGLYIIKVKTENETEIKKFLKE